MGDPFHEGYLRASEIGWMTVKYPGVRFTIASPYFCGTIQHRVWLEGWNECLADCKPRPPPREPEFA